MSAVATYIPALGRFEFERLQATGSHLSRNLNRFLKLVTDPWIILFNSRNIRKKLWVRGVERIQELGGPCPIIWELVVDVGSSFSYIYKSITVTINVSLEEHAC